MSDQRGYPGAPPGWYPDPAGGPGERWWDGYAWSEVTKPPEQDETNQPCDESGQRGGDQDDQPTVDASGYPGAPPGWYPDPAGGPGLRWWDGYAWTDSTVLPEQPPPPPWASAARSSQPGLPRRRQYRPPQPHLGPLCFQQESGCNPHC